MWRRGQRSEFRGINAPDVHNREVDKGKVNKVNRGACDGEVVIDSGESNGEVVGDGIGGVTTTSVNCGEVK